VRSTPGGPARHRLTTRTPGPLDSLPRPLAEHERRGRGRLGFGRRTLAVAGAAIVAGVVAVGASSLTQAPGGPVGEVAGAEASSMPDGFAGGGGGASRGGAAQVSARPTAPATGMDPVASPRPVAPPIATLSGYQWPLPHGRLTLPFGPSPWGSRIVDGQKFHDGVDLATFCGDRVVAAHAGTVLAAGRHYDGVMGWVGDLAPYTTRLDEKHLWGSLPIVVVIDDGNGYRSMYAHFGKVVVKKGEQVRAGQLLGYEGRTGRASGCHLHYGLFSPLETKTFGIDKIVVKHMKLPAHQIARVDPLLVLPPKPKPSKDSSMAASPTPGPDGPAPSADSP
jgi:murein DD-endopeptidase MepM/ murein hydrolase activator NlpD